jgi:ribosomal-protein-alanine N-acetyltransferase
MQPILQTSRLILRPFEESDAPLLSRLAGTRRIADTTASIPHPYSPEQALTDISRFRDEFARGTAFHACIELCPAGSADFIGYVVLKHIHRDYQSAELGFWIDEASSGKGYVTEAGDAALDFAFGPLALNRVCAYCMVRNPASGRVLARLGFRQEGLLRQCVRKWDVFEDVLLWSILGEDRRR